MDGPSSATISQQKRVLPSRSRRGGPGLGTCDVDNLILETRRRKYENEPLIPADTRFLLTTDPAYDAEPSDGSHSGMQINIVANERYFDRPDVLNAFREQTIIQTPEFHELQGLVSGVGSRFRPRNQEEAMSETSDAAYEKRHKKFETYEKRQRFREKEKLKHEHYKLKERIDQLRAMEGAAFMNLPESSFSPTPSRLIGTEDTEDDSASVAAMTGGIFHPEGERRRKEMLDIAVKLERRYAYLLPPDRNRKGQDSSNVATASTRSTAAPDEEDSDGEQILIAGPSRKASALKVRLPPLKSSASSTPTPSPNPAKVSAPKKLRLSQSMSRSVSTRSRRKSSPTPNRYPSPPPPPMQHLPPTEQRPIIGHSPVIDIERESLDPERPLTSPPSTAPPSPEPSSKLSALAAEHSVQDSPPPELSLEKEEEVANRSPRNGTRIIQMAPTSLPSLPAAQDLDVEMQPVNDDGESEKALSEALEPAKPLKTVSKSKQKVKGKERRNSTKPLPLSGKKKKSKKSALREEQPPEGEVIVVSKRPSPTSDPAIQNEDGVGQRPEYSPLPLETVSETTNAKPQPTVDTKVDHDLPAEAPQEPVAEDSVSVRPSKRRRKDKEIPLESLSAAARTPSAQPSERERATITARHRGAPFMVYTSETDGRIVRTYSTMVIAALRYKDGKRRVGRDRYAFGSPTPEFQKQAEVEFDLPMYFRYAREASASVDSEEEDDADEEEVEEEVPPSSAEVEDDQEQDEMDEYGEEKILEHDETDSQSLTDPSTDQPMETASTPTSDENALEDIVESTVQDQGRDLEIIHSPEPEDQIDTGGLKVPHLTHAVPARDEEDEAVAFT